jgi:hypothetical protein
MAARPRVQICLKNIFFFAENNLESKTLFVLLAAEATKILEGRFVEQKLDLSCSFKYGYPVGYLSTLPYYWIQ